MDGYALVSSEASRVYFMSFYIVTMIVITIVVAFVLDAFLFRIQYKRKMGDIDSEYLTTALFVVESFIATCDSQLSLYHNLTTARFDCANHDLRIRLQKTHWWSSTKR